MQKKNKKGGGGGGATTAGKMNAPAKSKRPQTDAKQKGAARGLGVGGVERMWAGPRFMLLRCGGKCSDGWVGNLLG